ncbi:MULTISPECIES: ribosomal L7Ae/L30e/S12e/Gadd45 family protein [Paenibacillus]|uniref:Ribosomal L7Ae/L30e/S12e/Gadd45 family protein n=1 Tax=Paenibacillus medicaginis TaxID=1470560 RepID=A0ABV5C7M3_9BACL
MSKEQSLQDAHVKIGTKQTIKMVELGFASEVYLAEDADPRLTSRLIELCDKHGVKVTLVDTMSNLGKACGIEVGAAMAAIVKQ